LLTDCQSSGSLFCRGFVAGVVDAMAAAQFANGTVAGWRTCPSKDVNLKQALDSAVAFLTSHPELRHWAAAALVAEALAEAFPCSAP